MKFFIDTEFSERGPQHPIQLISIGIVAEDGREFYAHSADYDARACNAWVQENVLPHVATEPPMSLRSIRESIKLFIGDDKPEFWGYYSDYDWVVFCHIFGAMIDLPKGWPMYCRDLKQWCDELGNPKLPQQSSTEHNALNDARWNREVFDFLRGHRLSQGERGMKKEIEEFVDWMFRPTFLDWVRCPNFEYEDAYVKAHADGSMEGRPIQEVFIYAHD